MEIFEPADIDFSRDGLRRSFKGTLRSWNGFVGSATGEANLNCKQFANK
jgi:hypothetical protein